MKRIAVILVLLTASCMPMEEADNYNEQIKLMKAQFDLLEHRIAVQEAMFAVHMDSLHTLQEQHQVMVGTLRALDQMKQQP